MPTYVYACKDKDHPVKETVHKMSEDPEILCETCKTKMHRKPQRMRFYINPFDVLADWSHENLKRYQARKRGHKGDLAKRFSPDHVNRPQGLPGRDFDTRSNKK